MEKVQLKILKNLCKGNDVLTSFKNVLNECEYFSDIKQVEYVAKAIGTNFETNTLKEDVFTAVRQQYPRLLDAREKLEKSFL